MATVRRLYNLVDRLPATMLYCSRYELEAAYAAFAATHRVPSPLENGEWEPYEAARQWGRGVNEDFGSFRKALAWRFFGGEWPSDEVGPAERELLAAWKMPAKNYRALTEMLDMPDGDLLLRHFLEVRSDRSDESPYFFDNLEVYLKIVKAKGSDYVLKHKRAVWWRDIEGKIVSGIPATLAPTCAYIGISQYSEYILLKPLIKKHGAESIRDFLANASEGAKEALAKDNSLFYEEWFRELKRFIHPQSNIGEWIKLVNRFGIRRLIRFCVSSTESARRTFCKHPDLLEAAWFLAVSHRIDDRIQSINVERIEADAYEHVPPTYRYELILGISPLQLAAGWLNRREAHKWMLDGCKVDPKTAYLRNTNIPQEYWYSIKSRAVAEWVERKLPVLMKTRLVHGPALQQMEFQLISLLDEVQEEYLVNGVNTDPEKVFEAAARHRELLMMAEMGEDVPLPRWRPSLEQEERKIAGVRQIVSSAHLRREGSEMEHCVGGYVGACLARKSYIFSVQAGKERATAEVALIEGNWQVCQFRGYKNSTPHSSCNAILSQWCQANGVTRAFC